MGRASSEVMNKRHPSVTSVRQSHPLPVDTQQRVLCLTHPFLPHQDLTYRIIHWVNECVVVEDKAVAHQIGDDEIAQVIAYLAATGAKVGLLLNFGRHRLEYKRILPPKSLQDWQTHIAKYLWRPNSQNAEENE